MQRFESQIKWLISQNLLRIITPNYVFQTLRIIQKFTTAEKLTCVLSARHQHLSEVLWKCLLKIHYSKVKSFSYILRQIWIPGLKWSKTSEFNNNQEFSIYLLERIRHWIQQKTPRSIFLSITSLERNFWAKTSKKANKKAQIKIV